jgi:hypothetical protein
MMEQLTTAQRVIAMVTTVVSGDTAGEEELVRDLRQLSMGDLVNTCWVASELAAVQMAFNIGGAESLNDDGAVRDPIVQEAVLQWLRQVALWIAADDS